VEHQREEHSWCCQLGDSQARNTTSGDKRQIAAIMHLCHLKWLLIGQRRFCEVYSTGSGRVLPTMRLRHNPEVAVVGPAGRRCGNDTILFLGFDSHAHRCALSLSGQRTQTTDAPQASHPAFTLGKRRAPPNTDLSEINPAALDPLTEQELAQRSESPRGLPRKP
jgi:hypothetical protein